MRLGPLASLSISRRANISGVYFWYQPTSSQHWKPAVCFQVPLVTPVPQTLFKLPLTSQRLEFQMAALSGQGKCQWAQEPGCRSQHCPPTPSEAPQSLLPRTELLFGEAGAAAFIGLGACFQTILGGRHPLPCPVTALCVPLLQWLLHRHLGFRSRMCRPLQV